VIRGTQSQIPAAPTRAPTSHLSTTTTATRTSQLPTLRKIENRADISKRLSTPFHPTGTVGNPGRTSKKHFRCQDLAGTTFQVRLSSGTPTLTGLWPVARRAPSRRQKSSTPPLHSFACNSIVATSLLRSTPSSTRIRAGTWNTTGFVSLAYTSTCSPDLISSRASKETLSLKPLLRASRPAFAHSSAEDLFRPRYTRYTCRPTPGPRYQQQPPPRKTDRPSRGSSSAGKSRTPAKPSGNKAKPPTSKRKLWNPPPLLASLPTLTSGSKLELPLLSSA
jgi:hypothetical protein